MDDVIHNIKYCEYCNHYSLTDLRRYLHENTNQHKEKILDVIARIKRKKYIEENSWRVSRIMT